MSSNFGLGDGGHGMTTTVTQRTVASNKLVVMKRAILYARRSSEKNDDAFTLSSQLEGCRKYAEAHNMIVVEAVSEEYTGTVHLRDRRSGAAVFGMLERQEADALVVYQVDRLSRADLVDALVLVRDILNTQSELHIIDRPPVTDVNDIKLVIDAWSSSEERKRIIERMQRGKHTKALNGKIMGDGRLQFWIRKIGLRKDATFELIADKAALVREIFRLMLGDEEHKPINASTIARKLNERGEPAPHGGREWYTGTVSHILKDTATWGRFVYDGVEFMIPHLAVIDEATQRAAADRLRVNAERSMRSRKSEYLCAGHLKCFCGRSMTGKYATEISGKRHYYYHCSASSTLSGSIKGYHQDRYISMKLIDQKIWQYVLSSIDEEQLAAEAKANPARPLDRLRERLMELDATIELERKRIEKLIGKFANDNDSDVQLLTDKQIDLAKKRRTIAQQERVAIVDRLAQSAPAASVLEKVRQYRESILMADYALKREILAALNVRGKLKKQRIRYALTISSDIAPSKTVWVGRIHKRRKDYARSSA